MTNTHNFSIYIFPLCLLLWRNVDGDVNIYNIDMLHFIMVSNKLKKKCCICKVEFTHSQKSYYHSQIFSSPYNVTLGTVFINFG